MKEFDVFISYSRKDYDLVQPIISEISSLGIKVWYDLDGIESGDEFSARIINAIENSDSVIFMYSENAVKSEWAKKELGYASRLGMKVRPILINGIMPTTGWFSFDYGNRDCIDITNKIQKEKLIENLKKTYSERIELTKKEIRKDIEEENVEIETFDIENYVVEQEDLSTPYKTRIEAKNGNIDAMIAYGIMCLRGEGIDQNFEEALTLFSNAGALGDKRGTYVVAHWHAIKEKYNVAGETITIRINDEIWTKEEVEKDIRDGGKFVTFTYVISAILFVHICDSKVYYIKSDEYPIKRGWKYLLISCIFGWWSVQGFIATINAIEKAFSGEDTTEYVLENLVKSE